MCDFSCSFSSRITDSALQKLGEPDSPCVERPTPAPASRHTVGPQQTTREGQGWGWLELEVAAGEIAHCCCGLCVWPRPPGPPVPGHAPTRPRPQSPRILARASTALKRALSPSTCRGGDRACGAGGGGTLGPGGCPRADVTQMGYGQGGAGTPRMGQPGAPGCPSVRTACPPRPAPS